MIPITRKELYLNKIVGNDDYSVPEKPISEEEFFFAEILGEAVQAPEPLTRYQMYLAKIAGHNIEIPTPITRLEYFLARTAGMEIETPTPITREEIFWSNYSAIVDFEVEGVPPLTYKAIEGTLENYRIYGDTVDGESAGDRTGNLFDGAVEQGSFNVETGNETVLNIRVRSKSITLGAGNYTISAAGVDAAIVMVYLIDGTYTKLESIVSYNNLPFSFSLDAERIIRFAFKKNDNSGILPSDISNMMLNSGSTPLPYEPYGYKVPVTVEGKNLFDINNLEDHYDISSETGLPVRNSAYSYLRCAITTPINVSAGDYYLTFNKNIAGEIGFIVSVFENNTLISRTPGYYSGSRIRISSGNNIYIGFHNQNVAVAIHPSDISNIMLNSGSTALPYEPYHVPVTVPIYLPEQIKKVGDEAEYVDYGEQKQHRVRKNLLPTTATSQTKNGVTFTVNGDGSVTCNGTANGGTVLFQISAITLPAGQYSINGCPAGGTENTTYKILILANNAWLTNDKGSGANFTLTETSTVSVMIAIYNGYTCNNLTFYPMIRKADIEDDTYEPYITNTELDVTLPALPTLSGTNTLSVGTEVQPSKVYVKGEKERENS